MKTNVIRYSKKGIPKAVIMLGIVSLFTDAASEMIYPLIPVYVAALGSGAILLGVIEGVAETTASMLKLVSGILSDKIGKRKLLVLIGYSISSVIRPLTGIVSSAWQIIFIRMLDRVGKGIRTAPRDALIASSVDESIRGKSYGFHRAMDHTGAVIGPVLAIMTLLILFSIFGMKDSLVALRWTFILAIIPGLLAVLTIILFVKESVPKSGNGTQVVFSLKTYDKNFRTYLLIMILFTLGNSSDAFLLFRVQEAISKSGSVVNIVSSIAPLHSMVINFGNEAAQARVINILFLPLIWAFFHSIKVIFSTPLGTLSDKIGRKKVINIGWGIYAFVYFSFALLVFLPPAIQIIATFILFAVYALFYAFTEGAEKAFVADLVNDERRGTAFGLFNFSIGLGALPASIIFGFLYSSFDVHFPGFGGTVAFGFGGTIAIISMILLAIKVKEPSMSSF
ncbi:MAG: MFS transporter [Bacteroidetes bacterium]|nr:MAG: MFS transporter [Bacteroidota bacterium]